MLVMISTLLSYHLFFFFFFNDTATTEIYTLSLHDALPISRFGYWYTDLQDRGVTTGTPRFLWDSASTDRKSTRLNSSHGYISYAVFCLKKKKIIVQIALRITPTPGLVSNS